MSERGKSLDRLELTRQKFARMRSGQETREERLESRENFGLSACPICGRMTVKHEGGCEQCTSCGWSACG